MDLGVDVSVKNIIKIFNQEFLIYLKLCSLFFLHHFSYFLSTFLLLNSIFQSLSVHFIGFCRSKIFYCSNELFLFKTTLSFSFAWVFSSLSHLSDLRVSSPAFLRSACYLSSKFVHWRPFYDLYLLNPFRMIFVQVYLQASIVHGQTWTTAVTPELLTVKWCCPSKIEPCQFDHQCPVIFAVADMKVTKSFLCSFSLAVTARPLWEEFFLHLLTVFIKCWKSNF